MNAADVTLIFLAFAAGGILKGAAGAGAPLLAVPLMAMLSDIQFAVAVFVLPNIVPNLWQGIQYRHRISSPRLAWTFAIAGGIGAGLGTIALAGLHSDKLLLGVGLVLAVYILFRLLKPDWQLSRPLANRLAAPVGIFAGALQGATGLSAPASITFLNAVKLEREDFMATISMFFVALGLVQLPAQFGYGIMTPQRLFYSALALVPLLLCMPLGAWIGRRLPRKAFDYAILLILGILSVRLIWEGIA